jgi:hypothetical protein
VSEKNSCLAETPPKTYWESPSLAHYGDSYTTRASQQSTYATKSAAITTLDTAKAQKET